MRFALVFFVAAAACSRPPEPQPVADPLSFTSPLMGSGGFAFAAGSAFVGACVPHGLAKPGPDTIGKKYGALRFLHYSGYWAGDETIRGFSQLHLHGTGATDYGALTLAPADATLATPFDEDAYASEFAKKSEQSTPSYYRAHLDRWGVDAELTASAHVAHHRYTWAEGSRPRVVVDLTRVLPPGTTEERTLTQAAPDVLNGKVRIKGEMSDGFGGNVLFFELRSSVPFASVTPQGDEGAVLDFGAVTTVSLRVGLSLASAAGATAALDGEPATFDAAREAADAEWRTLLSRVTVYGGSDDERKTFYSALHHAFLMPTVISDRDGAYVFGGQARTAPDPTLSDFSLWDTYRTVHPLYALVAPASAAMAAKSLVRQAEALGGFTRWPLGTGETGTMLGSPADIVVADAALRGADFDHARAWALLRERAFATVPDTMMGTRRSSPSYRTLGFVPSTEDGRSGALTLEYAGADAALAAFAERQGATADAEALRARSRGWRKLFDPALKVVRPRQADGTPKPGEFDPLSWEDFAESSALQNTWGAPHDLDGYAELFGSREAFVSALEQFFDATPAELDALAKEPYELRYFPNDHFWAGNEPMLHAPFMFAQAGRVDLTAKWSVWTRNRHFSWKPDGLPGNDDGGTMASWYVLAMLGLYPLPGSDVWVLGSPGFPKVTVNGFTIEARDLSAENTVPKSVTLDGVAVEGNTLKHAQLKSGSTLVFQMGAP
ncbi:MAG: GH92 family glycosyl hydrolase [Myxococcaceae bacterium]|nr:GH92 family glycosyl hydrolase [Myxococcaceae bacterium]